jgi:hypothetical protein
MMQYKIGDVHSDMFDVCIFLDINVKNAFLS